MTDHTSAVIRLENAYSSMQLARARAAAEIRAQYREVIKKEIAARQLAAEVEFARTMAIEHEAGLPGNVIRTEVLRTNDWNRWKKWRDLAGIDPDRVTRENAREAKSRENATYVWSDDYKTLTVLRGTDGKLLDTAIVYEMPERLKKVGGDVYWPVPVDEAVERVAYEGNQAYIKNLSAEISAQIEAGNVPGPNNT